MTPSRSIEHPRATWNYGSEYSVAGGIELNSCESASASTPRSITPQHTTTQQSHSSARAANICVRRSKYASTLSQSPARAGYATRMRELFEEASCHGQLQSADSALYPQLPNISRKATPSAAKTEASQQIAASPSYRPESLCLPINLPVALSSVGAQASVQRRSERSSGSWSDDSGYIITHSLGRSSTSATLSKEWICNWLEEVYDYRCDSRSDFRDGHDELTAATQNERVAIEALSTKRTSKSCTTLPEQQAVLEDPFMGRENDQRSVTLHQTNLQQTSSQANLTPRHMFNPCNPSVPSYLSEAHTPPPKVGPGMESRKLPSATNASGVHVDVEGSGEGGVLLSPLSPNVCIERGPSRHHSNLKARNTDILATSSTESPTSHLQATRLKENTALKQENVEKTCSPIMTRSGLRGTRFRPW